MKSIQHDAEKLKTEVDRELSRRTYKTVKKVVPFCKDCDQEITGNGSMVLPYACGCGIRGADL